MCRQATPGPIYTHATITHSASRRLFFCRLTRGGEADPAALAGARTAAEEECELAASTCYLQYTRPALRQGGGKRAGLEILHTHVPKALRGPSGATSASRSVLASTLNATGQPRGPSYRCGKST